MKGMYVKELSKGSLHPVFKLVVKNKFP